MANPGRAMRRVGDLWPQIYAYPTLERAALRAARGKRHRPAVARFLQDLEPEVLRLQRELAGGTWRPAAPHVFEIHDPKRRLISAPPFPDRVVHHALVGVLEPILDRGMIGTSFACRRGKGTHAALRCAQEFVRRFPWSLKLDVSQFFPSLSHEVVLAMIARKVKDRGVLGLCRTIVCGNSEPGEVRGLPIGALTSQWFANLVLDRLDHHVKEELRLPGYLRYMDDFICFAPSREVLQVALLDIRIFLADRLRLSLKERDTRLAPSALGVPFLGWSVYPGLLRIRRRNLRRLEQRVRRSAWELRTGRRDRSSFEASIRAVWNHLAAGNTLTLRRRWAWSRPEDARAPPRTLP